MAPKKMLVDATHPEETRVVVTNGNRIEEFDFESANRLQLRGNIYLAKVTRVEPSLQAAFVDYGGNRHGFLAFSEIHPDYYQIPVSDREALLEQERLDEQADAAEDEKAAEAAKEEKPKRRRRRGGRNKAASVETDEVKGDAPAGEETSSENGDAVAASEGDVAEATSPQETPEDTPVSETPIGESPADSDQNEAETVEDSAETETAEPASEETSADSESTESAESAESESSDETDSDDKQVESVGSEDDDDAMEEVPVRRRRRAKTYKIQEVIKRRQILLIQVVKEERGNKGAALTTYLSLAGRYSVLMPNTARGGGISRKITNVTDRKRLKDIVGSLNVPEGMGIILRTAGAARTKSEVQRDFEYLLRLWENVRSLTLESSAPMLVYEEGSLIKRSIRDLYKKDIAEILIAGEAAHKEATAFMEMLTPSHAKNVLLYNESQPIFAKFNVEAQLDAMFSPQVTLKSGGYLVINPTEALVSVDVNSGRSTKEHSIEDTALQTNLEAADEVARQLRLRDMAGLVVIDFIDMEENRNNRAVERRLKDALKNDRARIQVGRISHFGLMEMSRQRLRAGVLEGSTNICPHCQGTGLLRSVESVALLVLRATEDHLMRKSSNNIKVHTRSDVALYILNEKRDSLTSIEAQYGVNISILVDETVGPEHFTIEKGDTTQDTKQDTKGRSNHVRVDSHSVEQDEDKSGRKRRSRGGRNRDDSRDENKRDEANTENASEERSETSTTGDEEAPRRRRRGRRGGKRNRNRNGEGTDDNGTENAVVAQESDQSDAPSEAPAEQDVQNTVAEATEKPKRRRSRRKKPEAEENAADASASDTSSVDENTSVEAAPEADASEEKPKKPRRRSRKKVQDEPASDAAVTEIIASEAAPAEEAKKPRRRRAKPKEAETVASAPQESVPKESAPQDDVAEKPAKPARKPRKKAAAKSGEIVVTSATPEATGSDSAKDASTDSKKKGGWWQRGFLS